MTVYFTASIVGKKQYLSYYLEIIDTFKTKNIDVVYEHIINTSQTQIRQEKIEDRLKFHIQLDKWISCCDFVVAEVSFPSISVGYEISLAQNLGKPVLVLFSNSHPPSLLADYYNEKIICQRYNLATVKKIIEDFINHIKKIHDVKFTFFIPAEMNAFLDSIARKEKLSKSVYLRRLIKEDMENVFK